MLSWLRESAGENAGFSGHGLLGGGALTPVPCVTLYLGGNPFEPLFCHHENGNNSSACCRGSFEGKIR